MEANSIVPDVIDTIPANVVKISYTNELKVDLGNELTPNQTKDEPIEVEWPVEEGALYALCLTDPDAPARRLHFLREVKHWLVINIPGFDIKSGQTICAYAGPGPPRFTGLHRYVFVVYKQPNKIEYTNKVIDADTRSGRMRFKVRDFAKTYNLGEPIAANFYQSKFSAQ